MKTKVFVLLYAIYVLLIGVTPLLMVYTAATLPIVLKWILIGSAVVMNILHVPNVVRDFKKVYMRYLSE